MACESHGSSPTRNPTCVAPLPLHAPSPTALQSHLPRTCAQRACHPRGPSPLETTCHQPGLEPGRQRPRRLPSEGAAKMDCPLKALTKKHFPAPTRHLPAHWTAKGRHQNPVSPQDWDSTGRTSRTLECALHRCCGRFFDRRCWPHFEAAGGGRIGKSPRGCARCR